MGRATAEKNPPALGGVERGCGRALQRLSSTSQLAPILVKVAAGYLMCAGWMPLTFLSVHLHPLRGQAEAVVVDSAHVVVAHRVFATEAAADAAAAFVGSDVEVIVKDGTAFKDVVAVVDAFAGRGVRVALVLDPKASPRGTAPWRG